jgi:hypothetical protein
MGRGQIGKLSLAVGQLGHYVFFTGKVMQYIHYKRLLVSCD